MSTLVYLLCVAASSGCALLLIRGYRKSRHRLLLWTALCFSCFAVNNLLVYLDLVVFPDTSLGIARALATLTGVTVLVGGLIFDRRV